MVNTLKESQPWVNIPIIDKNLECVTLIYNANIWGAFILNFDKLIQIYKMCKYVMSILINISLNDTNRF